MTTAEPTTTTTTEPTTATSEQQPGSEQQATTTKDSGANFRESQPKEAGETEKGEIGTDPEVPDTEKSDSRFGIAGKTGSRGSVFVFVYLCSVLCFQLYSLQKISM